MPPRLLVVVLRRLELPPLNIDMSLEMMLRMGVGLPGLVRR